MSFLSRLFSNSDKSSVQPDISPQGQGYNFPLYVRLPMILLGLFLFFYILSILRSVLIPLSYGFLIAVLLNPLVNRLRRWRVPKVLAIFIALLVAVITLVSIFYFIGSQVSRFTEMSDVFKERFMTLYDESQAWIKSTFNIKYETQNAKVQEFLGQSSTMIGGAVSNTLGFLGDLFLVMVYVFMILFYKRLFLEFIYEIFDKRYEKDVKHIVHESNEAIQSYIVGLLIEMGIMAVLLSITYLSLGIEYAILLGILGAILNLIPYIGGIVGVALPLIMYMLTGDGGLTTPILIVSLYTLLQLVDNYYIVPKVVSSKVSINAFFTVLMVLLGNLIWGASGMFLSIIFVGVLKIIFDKIPNMRPYGKVMGELK